MCVGLLTERYAQLGMKPVQNSVMDVRSLDFNDASFDAVLDKATLDSVLVGEGGVESVDRMLAEVSRVLKDSGYYCLLSNAPPEQRLALLEKPAYGWKSQVHTIPKPTPSGLPSPPAATGAAAAAAAAAANFYLYIMSKES